MAALHGAQFEPEAQRFTSAHISSFQHFEELYERSVSDSREFWAQMGREMLTWKHQFQDVNDSDFAEGMIAWFLGGKLNACDNCVDRHVPERGNEIAIIWESDEPGQSPQITYRELQRGVAS